MKARTMVLAAAVLVVASVGGARAGDGPGTLRAVDVKASKALFEVGHLYVTKVQGTIPIVSGNVVLMPDSAVPVRVDAVLDPRGVRTDDDERDDDLQGGDWFDTKRFPTWTYVGTSVVTGTDGHMTIEGTLTVHGVAQPVALDATIVRGLPNPLYHAVGHADRHAFGMATTRIDALVGNDITIVLDVALRP
jgi:polyisoprenoid-binding protein YceI